MRSTGAQQRRHARTSRQPVSAGGRRLAHLLPQLALAHQLRLQRPDPPGRLFKQLQRHAGLLRTRRRADVACGAAAFACLQAGGPGAPRRPPQLKAAPQAAGACCLPLARPLRSPRGHDDTRGLQGAVFLRQGKSAQAARQGAPPVTKAAVTYASSAGRRAAWRSSHPQQPALKARRVHGGAARSLCRQEGAGTVVRTPGMVVVTGRRLYQLTNPAVNRSLAT